MPTYCYVCPKCGQTTEEVRSMRDLDLYPNCTCGTVMGRDYGRENHRAGNKEYRQPIISNSLAVSPAQIPEHRRLFPEIEVTPQGQPIFTNYAQHEKYLTQCGFVKNPQKNRRRGKPLATGTA